MGHEIKIDVELGGTVTQGEPFKWKNTGPNKVKASGLTGVCPDDSYEVPAQGNGKAGEKDASVLATASIGDHTYQTGPTGNTPTLKVQGSMPTGKY
jgi:hypothetical protein